MSISGLPDPPSSLQVSSSFSKSLVVTWIKPMDGSSPISNYLVHWTADRSTLLEKVVTTTQATLNVVPYTFYTIKVKAQNKYGYSAWSTSIRQRSDEDGKEFCMQ